MNAANTAIGMTVFRIKDLKRWQDRIAARVRAGGREAMRKGASCQLWAQADLRPVAGTALRYVDGVRASIIKTCMNWPAWGRLEDGVSKTTTII
jgi:hypothetical protein